MAKFKKGDRVRCVRRDAAEGIVFEVGSLAIVKETYPATPYLLELTGGILVHTPRWEVAKIEPLTTSLSVELTHITIGGKRFRLVSED